MDILEAMKSSFLLGQSEKNDEAAKLLREDIISSYKDGEEDGEKLHWPKYIGRLLLTTCIAPPLFLSSWRGFSPAYHQEIQTHPREHVHVDHSTQLDRIYAVLLLIENGSYQTMW